MLYQFLLKNGIKVAAYHLPSVKSVHVNLAVKCGSLVESKADASVAHFLEHILVQGIPSLPDAEAFSQYVESLAGSFNASTSRLLVDFEITVPAIYLGDALKIASEVFFQPLFVAEAIKKERVALVNELSQKVDAHFYKISKFWSSHRFPKNHPLTVTAEDGLEAARRLDKQDLMRFWKSYFFPANTYLLIVGNFKPEALPKVCAEYFGRYGSSNRSFRFPSIDNRDLLDEPVALRHDHSLGTNYLDLTFPAVNLFDGIFDRVKHNLSLTILGQLRNSRLFKLLRYKRGLVYDVYSSATMLPNLGYVDISSQVNQENLDEVVELIIKELSTFASHGPTAQELEFAKNYLANRWMMAFDHPSSIAGWIEGGLLWEDEIMMPEDFALMTKDVKPADIVELMQKYWDFSKLNLTIQGPVENTISNIKKYERMVRGG